MAITVKRCGVTASRYFFETDNVSVDVRGGDEVSVDFVIASKGGGKTRVSVRIDCESFGELAAAMVKADKEAANEAFKLALKKRPTTVSA